MKEELLMELNATMDALIDKIKGDIGRTEVEVSKMLIETLEEQDMNSLIRRTIHLKSRGIIQPINQTANEITM